MKNTTINVLLFTAGAAIGSLVTWKIVKTKYERIANEEIESMKNVLERQEHKRGQRRETSTIGDSCRDPATIREYYSLIDSYDHSGDDTEDDEEGEGGDEAAYINGPIVITPEEFGDQGFDHECWCITYYADGVLADDWGVKLDVDETIGEDSIKCFGDHAKDIIHVRNERLRCDYEVVRDPRTYAEAVLCESPGHAYED